MCPFHMFSHFCGIGYLFMLNRSEGFPRTGYLVPARGTPGVLPDGTPDARIVPTLGDTAKSLR